MLRHALFLLISMTVACTEATATDPGQNGPPAGNRPVGCGDGLLSGLEPCDGVAFAAGGACVDHGLGAGQVACTTTCTLDFSGCAETDYCQANGLYDDGNCDACDLLGGSADTECASLCPADDGVCADVWDSRAGVYTCQNVGLSDPDCGTCGNGVIEGNEMCDGTQLNGTCQDFGYTSGSLACSGECTPDFARCANCGDGHAGGTEECDGADFDGQSCATQGFDHGTLSCALDCTFDTSGCSYDMLDWSTLADGWCDYLVRCEDVFGRAVADESTCQDAFIEMMSCEYDGDEGFFDQEVLDGCGDALHAASCAAGEMWGGVEECSGLFGAGEVSVGPAGPCMYLECDEDEYCHGEMGEFTVCAECRPIPGLGQPCEYWCTAPYWCDRYGTGLCAAPLADGEPCDGDSHCVSGYCLCADAGCVSEVCGTPAGAGATCYDDEACLGFYACLGGQCSDRVLTGSPCSYDDDCLVYDECDGGECVFAWTCESDPLGPGDPCDWDDQCPAGYHCDWNLETCQLLASAGDSCDDPWDCVEGAYCDQGTGRCAAYVPLGGDCSGGQLCVADAYCDGEVCLALVAAGGDCSGGQVCGREAFCDQLTGLCSLPKPNGAQCVDPDLWSRECGEGFCIAGFCSLPPPCE